MLKESRALCSDCVFFHVTYDVNRPWGCRHFGFKSQKIPAQVVKETSGTKCASKQVKRPIVQQKRTAGHGK